MNDPRVRHSTFNAQSRDQWDRFEPHRVRIRDGILAEAPGHKGRLCVLGAGNCNDLDLGALLDAFGEVHLVDLDADAIEQGTIHQGVHLSPRLTTWGNQDLTRMIDAFSTWDATSALHDNDFKALIEWPSRFIPDAIKGPFDVVASTCVMSQLIGNAYHSVGESHPRFMAVVQAIRTGHLRLMASLLKPGGMGHIFNDLVSSETVPGLANLPEVELGGLVPQLIENRNFFHGMNPAIMQQAFLHDPILASRTTNLRQSSPWRWRLHDRFYLVSAFRFQKRMGDN